MKKSSRDVCLLLHEFVSYKILDLISYEMCSCIESKFPYSSNLAPLPLWVPQDPFQSTNNKGLFPLINFK